MRVFSWEKWEKPLAFPLTFSPHSPIIRQTGLPHRKNFGGINQKVSLVAGADIQEEAMKYGLQMYSLRDITEKDMEGALKEVAAMGYSFVEFAGFMGHSAHEIRDMLEKYGLRASGTHTGLAALTDELLVETIAYHKAIGCSDIIIPYEKFTTKAEIDAFVDRVAVLIPRLRAEGLNLHYHNHDIEFLPNEDGLIPQEELIKRTDILLEVDTYWVFAAGKDPVEVLNTYKDRIRVIHLKDGIGGHEGTSLGLGKAPVKAVRETAIALGLDMVVESEGLDPTGLEEVKRCIDFLKEVDAQ